MWKLFSSMSMYYIFTYPSSEQKCIGTIWPMCDRSIKLPFNPTTSLWGSLIRDNVKVLPKDRGTWSCLILSQTIKVSIAYWDWQLILTASGWDPSHHALSGPFDLTDSRSNNAVKFPKFRGELQGLAHLEMQLMSPMLGPALMSIGESLLPAPFK